MGGACCTGGAAVGVSVSVVVVVGGGGVCGGGGDGVEGGFIVASGIEVRLFVDVLFVVLCSRQVPFEKRRFESCRSMLVPIKQCEN